MCKFIALVADTRVGSTALGNGLDNGDTIQFLGEILYPQETESPRHLYGHLLGSDWRQLAISRENAFEVLDGFFMASHWASNAVHIADIKYHDLRLIPQHPASLLGRPPLLDYLVTRGIPIIHLNRENKIAAALSEYVAIKTAVFHARNDVAETSTALMVEPGTLVSGVLEREQNHAAVSQWLRDHEQVLDVSYEALFADSGRERLDAFLRDEWKIAHVSFRPQLKRLSAMGRVSVANIDEIELAFGGLRPAALVQAALKPYQPR